MSLIAEAAVAVSSMPFAGVTEGIVLSGGADAGTSLAAGGWDIIKFLNNLGNYGKEIAGAALIVVGIFAVGWGGFQIIRKLFGNNSGQGDSWFKIIMLIVVGGALMVGGFSVMEVFGKTGKATIDKLGRGAIMYDGIATYFKSGLGVTDVVKVLRL